MKKFVAVYSSENLRDDKDLCLSSCLKTENSGRCPTGFNQCLPQTTLELRSSGKLHSITKAKIKHVLLPHVLPHHDQLSKNLDGGAVMWIFLKTPQLILIYSQSWVETYHSIFLSFQGECDQKKRIQVRGGAKVEMGKLDKLIFQEWNFHLVPQHASKVHF